MLGHQGEKWRYYYCLSSFTNKYMTPLSFTGLMSFEELRKRILATSGKTRQDVSEDDMARAIKKLRVLGGGFAVIPVGKHRLVQSVPGELNMDHTAVLQKAEVGVAV